MVSFLKRIKANKRPIDWGNFYKYLAIALLIFIITFIVENNNMMKTSISDDLYGFETICKLGFFRYVFSIGKFYKFRPVARLVKYFIGLLSKNDPLIFGYFNVVVNFFISIIIFGISHKLSKNTYISVLASILYTTSRFAYYQVMLQQGITESMATLFSVIFLYYCLKYLEDRRRKDYIITVILFLLASFSHERYSVLFAAIFYSEIVSLDWNKVKKERKKLLRIAILALIGVAYAGFRFALLKNMAFSGTGNTDVINTFNINVFFRNFIDAFCYIIGFNPSRNIHLGMIGFSDFSGIGKISVIIADLLLLMLFFVGMINRKIEARLVKSIGLFILCILLVVAISSTTIRIELRWLYVPFCFLYLFAIYLISGNSFKNRNIQRLCILVFAISSSLTAAYNIYLREYYQNLYYYDEYIISSELRRETYDRFEDKIFEKKWIVIDDSHEIDFLKDMFEQYDVNDLKNINLEIFASPMDIRKEDLSGNTEILYYDVSKNDFINITENMRDLYDFVIKSEGIWDDGWCEKKASIKLNTRDCEIIKLSFYCPNHQEGFYINLFINGEKETVKFETDYIEKQIAVKDFDTCEIEFRSNFGRVLEDGRDDASFVLGYSVLK